jgi:hypothetical protein
VAAIRNSLLRGNLPWLLAVIAAGAATRVPHLAALASPSHELEVTYQPTLASTRFLECAREMLSGGVESDAFSFASPLYIPFLAAMLKLFSGQWAVFLVQSLAGVLTGVLVFAGGVKAGASRPAALASALLWLLYAPAAFFEGALLPVSLLALLITAWSILETGDGGVGSGFVKGLLLGVTAGMRPPFILLAAVSLLRGRRGIVPVLAGLLIPLAALSFWRLEQDGRFSPFAASTGLNLMLGHADGATGYGPPIPEQGLVESPGEDIHQAAARVAASRGYATPSAADGYWLKTALNWILRNPGREAELFLVKLGGALGYRPYDVYFDLRRDVESDGSLGHLPAPRALLVGFIALGAASLVFYPGRGGVFLTPVLVSLLSSLVFVHSERFWIPAIPSALAAASAGVSCLVRGRCGRGTLPVVIGITAVLLAPGALRPVPEIPLGQYLYNRGVKAYNLGSSSHALFLFEEAARVSPRGTATSIQAGVMALEISRALGLDGRARARALDLARELEDAGYGTGGPPPSWNPP